MFSTLLTFAASFVAIWAFVKYVVLVEIRVDSNTFKTLFDYLKQEKKFVLNEEFTSEARHPVIYNVFYFHKTIPWFFLSHSERLMQAGWHSKDYVTIITCMRWKYSKFKEFLNHGLKEASFRTHGVPVQLLLPYGIDRIGALSELAPEPMLDDCLWRDIDQEVCEMVEGKRKKTGALLYGPPGNGKTSLIKYLATKHRLPIMIFTLNPEWSNHDLLLLFSNIPRKCIVLLEDFDNYFDKRKVVFSGGSKEFVKFTFDVILNGLDGVFNSYDQVAFIMTVNDITKVDEALKYRPSRFKYTRFFDNPSLSIKSKLLPEDWIAAATDLNLDQIFRLHEFQKQGLDLSSALEKLDLKPSLLNKNEAVSDTIGEFTYQRSTNSSIK